MLLIIVLIFNSSIYNEKKDVFSKEEFSLSQREVYLTFDDGPSAYATISILDILEKYNIKASFFVVGKMVEKHPDILREIYMKGHTIGIHSYSHKYSEIYSSENALTNDIILTEKTIKKSIPTFKAKFYRFPGGSYGLNEDLLNVPSKLKLTIINWNSVIGDGEINDKKPETYLNIFKNSVKNKSTVVLLMHDGAYKSTTAMILPEIIEYFLKNNFSFKIFK